MIRSANPPEWPPTRHPFEVAAIAVFWLLGLLGLFGEGTFTLAQVLPDAVLTIWLLGLILSATLGGVAAVVAVRKPVLSLLCERLFLIGVGSFAVLYIVAVLTRGSFWNHPQVIPGTTSAIFPVMLLGAFAVAAFWRLWQVQTYLRWRFAVAAETKQATL